MEPSQAGRAGHMVMIDEGMRFGEAASALVVHRGYCKICGVTAHGGVNRRLCVVGDRYLSALVREWVAQGHHHSYAWLVSNAV